MMTRQRFCITGAVLLLASLANAQMQVTSTTVWIAADSGWENLGSTNYGNMSSLPLGLFSYNLYFTSYYGATASGGTETWSVTPFSVAFQNGSNQSVSPTPPYSQYTSIGQYHGALLIEFTVAQATNFTMQINCSDLSSPWAVEWDNAQLNMDGVQLYNWTYNTSAHSTTPLMPGHAYQLFLQSNFDSSDVNNPAVINRFFGNYLFFLTPVLAPIGR